MPSLPNEKCCGCGACVSVCQKNAISMKPDALGFLYSAVDAEKCAECALCEKICPVNAAEKNGALLGKEFSGREAFACIALDEEVRRQRQRRLRSACLRRK